MDNISENSIKSIYISIFHDQKKISCATGFLVKNSNDLYLLTNRHVVTGRNNETNECLSEHCALPNHVIIFLPSKDNDELIWSKVDIDLYDQYGKPKWLVHPKYKEIVDVVAIKLGRNLDKNTKNTIYYYNLKSEYEPLITENLYIVGYPYGYMVKNKSNPVAIWVKGSVASEPTLNLNIKNTEVPAFLVDAKTREGQSGSPVIFYDGNKVSFGPNIRKSGIINLHNKPITYEIGIYSGRINKESDLGYIWKWSIISEIIDGNTKESKCML